VKLLKLIASHRAALWWVALVSGLAFLATLLILPWIIVSIPEDYFTCSRRRPAWWGRQHPLVRWTLLLAKNLLGVVFILAGAAMLFIPGQGVVTILIGLTLTNFPGKLTLERRIVRQPTVSRSINWLRTRAGRPPLRIPSAGHHGEDCL
jgi:hypothetical protein